MRPTRRAVLAAAAAGLGLGAAGCALREVDAPAVVGADGRALGGSEADEVTGPFSWKRAEGARLRVLLADPTVSRALREHLDAFTAATGITVQATVLPEADYFDEVTRQLVSGLPDVDVFMSGGPPTWQYAPPGWMEDLDPWLASTSATAPDYDVDDLLPAVHDAMRWDGVLGHPVGTGRLWGLPIGWETTVLAYRADVLQRLGLRPPQTLADLEEVSRATAAHMAATVQGGYGLAVRGTRSWATVQAGMTSQLAREGGYDFVVRAQHLVPDLASPVSVDFHRRWCATVKEAGSPLWAEQAHQDCAADLGAGRAALLYDTTAVALPVDVAGASGSPGPLAFSPGPAGRAGDLSSNLWVWSLAISSRSENKLASWLLLQWASGAEHVRWSARSHGVTPVRTSVLDDGAYRQSLSGHRGYLEALDAVRPSTRTLFTPQASFFGTATAWAQTVQDVVSGSGVRVSLNTLTQQMRQRG